MMGATDHVAAVDVQFVISRFATATNEIGQAFGKMEVFDWPSFTDLIQQRRQGEKDGPNFVPATFTPEPNGQVRRIKTNVVSRTAIVLDIESNQKTGEIPPTILEAATRIQAEDWAAALYSSHSHTLEYPRYRLVLPISHDIGKDLPAVEVVAAALQLDGVIDTSKVGPASVFYLPSCQPGTLAGHETIFVEGDPVNADWITSAAETILAAREAERESQRQAAMEAAAKRRADRIARGFDPDSSIIELIRGHMDLRGELEAHGYRSAGKDRYLYPKSETGIPGVYVLASSDGVDRCFSHHSGDPLAAGNLPSWCRTKAVDVVDVAIILDHGGDLTAGLASLKTKFGIGAKTAQPEPPPDFDDPGYRDSQDSDFQSRTKDRSKGYTNGRDKGKSQSRSGPDGNPDPDIQTGLPLIWFNDLNPNLDAADFIEGILIAGAMSVIYGESNCGKTFFMADLALHVAMGRIWRGRAVDAGGVIYCALEGSHGIANRVSAFRKHHAIDNPKLPFAVIPYSLNLLDPDADTEPLIKAIKEAALKVGIPIVLVVIDTLSRALAGGNENAPDDMGALVTNTDRVRQMTGAHVAYIHHCGKDAAKGARGHSLLRAATDTEIEVTRDSKDRPSVAKVTKQREMEIDGEFTFELQVVELGHNKRGKPVTSCVVVEAKETSTAQTTSAARKLGKNAKVAFAMLQRAMSECGRELPASSNYPAGTRAVMSEQWRQAFYAGMPGESPDHKRTTFRRARDELLVSGIIASVDDYVWFACQADERGGTF